MYYLMLLLSALTLFILFSYSKGKDFELPMKLTYCVIFLNLFVVILFTPKHEFSLNVVLICIAFSILSYIFFIDLKYRIIPNEFTLALCVLAVIFIINNHTHWVTFVKGGLYFGFVFLLIFIVTKQQIGFGDVKLSLPIGMFLGSGLLMNYLVVTFLTGACASILLLLLKKQNFKGQIAFGPYMVVGFIYLLLF